MKFFVIVVFFMCVILNAKSQNANKDGKLVKSSTSVTEYDRSGLTMILLSYPNEPHSREIQNEFPKIKVPDKFDDNTLSTQIFTMNSNRNPNNSGLTSDLIQTMYANKIGNGIISKWYNRQTDGSFNMDEISRRGLYNATDMDVVNASAKKIGIAALKDSGEKLLANSYILVMDYSGVKTVEEIYNANNTPLASRSMHGWAGNFTAYLFKVNFNDSISSIFYNDLWIDSEDDNSIKTERSSKFQSINFPILFVKAVSGSITAQQPNPNSGIGLFIQQKSSGELFNDLLNKGIEQAEYQISKGLETFQVKTTVYSIDPIAAKIGKKEGLKLDHRYFIYENKVKSNGDEKTVRKAVVRATSHIIDNRTIATGKSNAVSKFYQIAGKRVDEGMLLKQKNDKGIGILATYSSGEIGGYGIGLEYLTRIATSFKIIGDIAFEDKNYLNEDILFMRYSMGFSKSMYFARNFQIEPSFSFGREEASDGSTNYDGSSLTFNSYYLKPGLKFGANIRYNIQLIAAANYYSFIGKMSDSNKETYTKSWDEVFEGRKGLSFDLGLRLQF